MAPKNKKKRFLPGIATGELHTVGTAQPSALKVYSTEVSLETCRLLTDIVGPNVLIESPSDKHVLESDLEHEYRLALINTLGSAVVEVLRGLVENFGLGMPRHRLQ